MRILIITHGPWTNKLGAVKVHYDLKIAYENLGHSVDVISLDLFFPNVRKINQLFLGSKFNNLVYKRLQSISKYYDLIDSNYGIITNCLYNFGFTGKIIVRSHGNHDIYDWYLSHPIFKYNITKFRKVGIKTKIGDLLRLILKNKNDLNILKSIKCANILHCLNYTELIYFRSIFGESKKIILFPNGLPDTFIDQAITLDVNRFGNNGISFIGSWTFRKGILDLNTIISQILAKSPTNLLIHLLGGDTSTEVMKKYFDNKIINNLNFIPSFSQEDLIERLQNIKVGIFTSYSEGMPLSVLEQISCGIPVIAYDIPGVRDMLINIDKRLLVEIGDKILFAERVLEILNLSESDYTCLSARCKNIAEDFRLSKLASNFINQIQTY